MTDLPETRRTRFTVVFDYPEQAKQVEAILASMRPSAYRKEILTGGGHAIWTEEGDVGANLDFR